MNILIVGCGTVGAALADQLCARGHDVSIVDANAESFSRLSQNFTGFTLTGVPIDSDVLRKAGIEGCDVVAAVTHNDNMNVMVAQMSKEIFGVPHVVTRIFDFRKREVFDQFGLNTVCQTSLTVSALASIIMGNSSGQLTLDQSTSISMEAVEPPREAMGRSVWELTPPAGQSIVGLLHRDGRITMMGDKERMVISEGDRVLFARAID